MGLFGKIAENINRQREMEKQRLMSLSEKELLAEILLELKLLNHTTNHIKHRQ